MKSGRMVFALVACACVALVAACGARALKVARADSSPPSPLMPATSSTTGGGAALTAEEEELNRRSLRLPLAEPRVVVEKGRDV